MEQKVHAMQFDTCLFDCVSEFLNWLRANDITFKILIWNGPAGGNPLIEYYGTKEQLQKLAIEQFHFDEIDENGEYYFGDIMEELNSLN